MRNLVFLGLLVLAFVSGEAFGAAYGGGSGEPNNPYLIASKADLLALAANTKDYGKCFILTADIDLDPNLPGGQVFTAAVIAANTNSNWAVFEGTAFTGTFDGNGHVIKNFTINASSQDYVGLFGYVGYDATICNLGVQGQHVAGRAYVGILAGYNDGGNISNCDSTGDVGGYYWVGGLVGCNYGGGSISNCYSTSTVSCSYEIGGLVGKNDSGNISNCYSTGAVVSVGSLGFPYNGYAGGFVGFNVNGSIVNCYSSDTVSGDSWSERVGGFVGSNYGSISNCYSIGALSHGGGLVGENASSGSSINNCFWDVNTSGRRASAGGTGKTTADMKKESTFTAAGWDFLGVWDINEGQTYPFFKSVGNMGTPENPYRIASKIDLLTMATDASQYNKCFILTADIDLEGQIFAKAIIAPDVNFASGFQGTPFTGIFNGNGHKIVHFSITGGYNHYFRGLFGEVGNGGSVKNLGIENFTVSGYWDVGGLVGYNSGGSIRNCHSTGAVSGSSSNSSYVGGLVGNNSGGIISNCCSTGTVSGGSNSSMFVGGLVGSSGGSISNCYSTSTVSGSQDVGGLVGNNGGSIGKSYSTGTISGSFCVGGLAGENFYDSISNCYSTGAVNGGSGSGSVGGLVGYNWWNSSISNCYSTGAVNGGSGSDGVAGLVGYNELSGSISNCYSTSAVSGGSDSFDVGGLVGYNDYGSPTTGFWDTQTSGQTTSAGGTGLDSIAMKTKSTFTDAGWDFGSIWSICEVTNYPRFLWQIPAGDFVCPDGVNFADFAAMANKWLSDSSEPDFEARYDMNGDSKVDFSDIAIFALHWLELGN